MIKSIVLQNFQSHCDTLLRLDPGVNLIVGQSDSGKTAILRALKWLATNRPLGDSFVAWGKDSMTARITMTDGTVVSHSPKTYMLLPPGKDASVQKWEAIGTTVPEAVTQALEISELSWQHQMDPPFLLSASPGEVARTLNEVADLDKIDSTLVNINRMARDNRTTLTATAQEKQRLEIELSQYQRLDGQLKMVTLLKEQERKAGELDALCETGEHLTQDVTRLNDKLTPIKRIVDAGDNLALLMSMERKAEGLESLIEKGESIRTESAHLRIRLERVRDTTDSEAMLDGLLDMVGQLKGAEGDIDNMGDQLVAVMKKQSYLKHASEQLIVLEKRWKAEFPSVCPLCGRGGK